MFAVEKNQVGIIDVFNGGATVRAQVEALRAKYPEAFNGGPDVNSADFNVRDNRGQTAFMYAIFNGYLEAAEKLGFVFTTRSDLEDVEGNTILHLLAADGKTSLVRRFEWYPNKTKENIEAGWYFDLARSLIRSSKLDQANRAGRTAWMLAAEKGHLDIVKHLMPNPPRDDLQHKDKSGKTGLDLARANNHQEVVAYLTKLQQDLSSKATAKDKKKD